MSKPYDIVLYGASGFTVGTTYRQEVRLTSQSQGKLCLRYLHNCKDAGSFKFAAAGRSAEKIKSALQEIGAPDIPMSAWLRCLCGHVVTDFHVAD